MDENYLALLTHGEPLEAPLTAEAVREISLRLFELLADRTESYMQGDSSSVRVELAEELLKSICFTLGIAVKWHGEGLGALKNSDMADLLREGWGQLESKIKKGRDLLQKVKESSPAVKNRSYFDTLAGIEPFFHNYDFRFLAHQTPGNIDYQICHSVPEGLMGVEYINEYLRRLLIENEFCGHFNATEIEALLESYCPDYVGLLINIFEPVAVNALGLALLGGGVRSLDISGGDRERLVNTFNVFAPEELCVMLDNAAQTVCGELGISNTDTEEYLKMTAGALCPRIKAALPKGDLSGIFLSLHRRGEKRAGAWF